MNQDIKNSREILLEQLGQVIRRQQRAVDQFDQAVVDHFGLNRTDGQVIDLLQGNGPMSAGELAKAANLTTGAITTATDRLEAFGLVQRRADPTDRRRVIIDVTLKTTQHCERIFGPLVATAQSVLERFSNDQLATIIEFLQLDIEIHELHLDKVQALKPYRFGRR